GSLALAGCGSKDDAPPPQGPAEVGVITLSPPSLDVTTTLPGRTTAYQIAEVRPQIGGIVQKRLFREGSDVKAGAVLYQIDPAVYQATYDSA
ncbi:biotin/lipoyl-binding protein, partial [Acinetobacter baumannii]